VVSEQRQLCEAQYEQCQPTANAAADGPKSSLATMSRGIKGGTKALSVIRRMGLFILYFTFYILY